MSFYRLIGNWSDAKAFMAPFVFHNFYFSCAFIVKASKLATEIFGKAENNSILNTIPCSFLPRFERLVSCYFGR